MRAMLFALLLTLAAALGVPVQAQQAYVWDGSSLQRIRGTEGITCSNWAMWYFKRGASQTPGSQWGAAVGGSANEVLNAYHESLKREEEGNAINVQYHLRGPDQHLYENYLGPICVTKTAFDATPGSVQAIENAGKLAGRINSLIAQIRTILNGARTAITTGYQGYYLQEGEKNQLEEYLERVEAIAENVHKVQNALMQHLGPTMMQINGQINTITQQLGQAENNLPAIRKLVSGSQNNIPRAPWMSSTVVVNNCPGCPSTQQTVQLTEDGVVRQTNTTNGASGSIDIPVREITFIAAIRRDSAGLWEVQVASNKGGAYLLFSTEESAQAAYDYFQSHKKQ
jgi:hypothetical protein